MNLREQLYGITWNHGTQATPKLIIVQFMATTTSDEAPERDADLVKEIVRGERVSPRLTGPPRKRQAVSHRP
jgi:hypothetical protein